MRIESLTHGYNGRTLFSDADLLIEKGERVAIIGPNGECLLGGRARSCPRRGWGKVSLCMYEGARLQLPTCVKGVRMNLIALPIHQLLITVF